MRWRNFIAILTVALVMTLPLFAGTTGKIAGRVIDAETKEPLPGVSVIIKELQMGAMTDINGYYYIINVPVGTYTVVARMIGYAEQEVQDVQVNADFTTTLDFTMSVKKIEIKKTVVKAKRKKIRKDKTSTTRVLDSKAMQELAVNNFQDVVAQQAGVVGEGNAMHVRGGRVGEVAYMVDGMSIKDPVAGYFGGSLSNSAVAEVSMITGGFNAEYGEAMSGVINVVMKEGGKKTEGMMKLVTDRLLYNTRYDYGTYQTEVSLGGPLPGFNKIRYFFAGDAYTTRDYDPAFVKQYDYFYPYNLPDSINGDSLRDLWASNGLDYTRYYWFFQPASYDPTTGEITKVDTILVLNTNGRNPDYWSDLGYITPHHWRQNYHGQGKVTLKFIPNVKININGFISREQYAYYFHSYKYDADNAYIALRKGRQLMASANWMINKDMFTTIKLGYFYNENTIGEQAANWYLYDYHLMDFFKDVEFQDTATMVPTDPSDPYVGYRQNPWGVINAGFYTGDIGKYHTRSSQYEALKWDLTWQINRIHQMKTGIDYKHYRVKLDEVYLPWDPNPFQDHYDVSPDVFAAYIQDKMEFEGMIVNAGIRLDLFNPAVYKKVDIYDTSSNPDTTPAEIKYKLSPRLGISHPISEKAVFHFSYGQFFQTPLMEYLYSYLHPDFARINSPIGNPDLDAERTTAYEVGFTSALMSNVTMDITGYYKDIYGLIGTRLVPAVPVPFYFFMNADYGNVKGIEMSLSYDSPFFSTSVAYTLSYAKGTGSDPWEGYWAYNEVDPVTGEPIGPPKTPIYLDFDQRHSIKTSFYINVPLNKMVSKTIQPMTIGIINDIGSGLPYTPTDNKGRRIGEANSARRPWTWTTDVRVKSGFNFGALKPIVFMDIKNLFDIKNVMSVYSNTGLPDDDGAEIKESDFSGDLPYYSSYYDMRRDLDGDGIQTQHETYITYLAAHEDKVYNPYNFGTPRTITFGMEIHF